MYEDTHISQKSLRNKRVLLPSEFDLDGDKQVRYMKFPTFLMCKTENLKLIVRNQNSKLPGIKRCREHQTEVHDSSCFHCFQSKSPEEHVPWVLWNKLTPFFSIHTPEDHINEHMLLQRESGAKGLSWREKEESFQGPSFTKHLMKHLSLMPKCVLK